MLQTRSRPAAVAAHLDLVAPPLDGDRVDEVRPVRCARPQLPHAADPASAPAGARGLLKRKRGLKAYFKGLAKARCQKTCERGAVRAWPTYGRPLMSFTNTSFLMPESYAAYPGWI